MSTPPQIGEFLGEQQVARYLAGVLPAALVLGKLKPERFLHPQPSSWRSTSILHFKEG